MVLQHSRPPSWHVSASEPKQPKPKGNILASFSVTEGDALVVPLRLGDRQYEFVLDTGSSQTIFDTSLRSHLGKPVDTRTLTTGTSLMNTDLYASTDRTDRRMAAPGRPLRCLHGLGRDAASLRPNIRGILGLTHLKDVIVQVDLDQGLGLIQDRLVPEEVREYEGMSFVYDSQGCMRIVGQGWRRGASIFHCGYRMFAHWHPYATALYEACGIAQLRIAGKKLRDAERPRFFARGPAIRSCGRSVPSS